MITYRYIEKYNHDIQMFMGKYTGGEWTRIAKPLNDEHAKQLLEHYQKTQPEYRFRIVPMIGGNGNGDTEGTEEVEEGPETQDWEESDEDTPIQLSK